MKQIIIIILVLIGRLSFGQVDFEKAEFEAKKDFKEGNYYFHSLEFLPTENTYLYVLREDYKVHWLFIGEDSLNFYHYYDSVLTASLKNKFGESFLKIATAKADSLENTENWIKKPEYPGSFSETDKFIYARLKIEKGDIRSKAKTRIFVHFTITEKGKLENFEIFRRINKKIDKKVIRIFEKMPDWSPAYLYGKPVRTYFTYPVIIELK